MKSLSKYLTEMSILDLDDDEVLDLRGTRLVINTELNNRTGDLWGYLDNPETSHCIINDDGVLTFDSCCEIKAGNPIMQKLQDEGIITGLNCSKLTVGDIPTITPKNITKDVHCADLFIQSTTGLKDLNITIDGSDNRPQYVKNYGPRNHNVRFQWCFDGIKFNNVNISYEKIKNRRSMSFNVGKMLDFKGLISNVENIRQYTLSDFPKEFEKLFQIGESCVVYDTQKKTEIDIPVKNLNKAIAIANNPKRYRLLSQILDLKPGAKLSSLFDLSGLKDLECFRIENNNVSLMFAKVGGEYDRLISFDRIPNPTETDVSKRYITTADGWRVIWIKR